jgi:hypothetical protein
MKKFILPGLLLAAVLLFALWPKENAQSQGGLIGPANAILCSQISNNNLTGTGSTVTTSLVAGVAGQTIVICGWHVTQSGTTAGTFQLEYGTQGGPCTSPTVLTPAFSVSSTAPATDHIDYASLSVPKSSATQLNQLCLVTTGAATSTLQIGIWFAVLM